MTESSQPTTDEARSERRKKPYEAPRIVLREALEAGAFICAGESNVGKTDNIACPAGPIGS